MYLDTINILDLTILELAERQAIFDSFPNDCRECRQPLREGEVMCHSMNLGGCEGYRLEHYQNLAAELQACLCRECRRLDELDQLRLEEDHT